MCDIASPKEYKLDIRDILSFYLKWLSNIKS